MVGQVSHTQDYFAELSATTWITMKKTQRLLIGFMQNSYQFCSQNAFF